MRSFKRDIQLYKIGKKTSTLRVFLDINIWIVLVYRFSNFFYNKNLFFISKIFWLFNRIIFSIDIDPGASLGPGLKLVHPIGIVIGRDVFSEGDLFVYQNVTIGGSDNKLRYYNGKKIEQPYFHKNVKIYSSSVVIGPIVVGNNSVIAANSTIFKDISANTMAYSVNMFKAIKEIEK
ncbi:serine acetyltransferase [Cellulophaga geojensis KL-A]|uniref:Serine acetyltransferase n=1 Tax=Cellulophaga geojensis KL-A TaxID=1328323 RepID=A0ABN0RRV9_9FLAO|nr:hypothetical protein [Cellulophaga geojensis]EWH14542.1 serine acetyltransferase [Cellulophaga geojensis KL-A]